MSEELRHKQMALAMWRWLLQDPHRGKADYQQHLRKRNREHEFHHCWACEWAHKARQHETDRVCKSCPVVWVANQQDVETPCTHEDSPFAAWAGLTYTPYELYDFVRHQKAREVYDLIKNTWEVKDE